MRFKFKKDAEGYHGTEDAFYALTEGYIDPKTMLSDKEQVKALKAAVKTVQDFINQAEAKELIGEDYGYDHDDEDEA